MAPPRRSGNHPQAAGGDLRRRTFGSFVTVRCLTGRPCRRGCRSKGVHSSSAATITRRASASPTRRPAPVTPLAPQRFKVQLTIGQETHDKLRRVQDLLRHAVPSGDPAVIIDRALTLLLRDLERRKLATVERV